MVKKIKGKAILKNWQMKSILDILQLPHLSAINGIGPSEPGFQKNMKNVTGTTPVVRVTF